MTTTEQIIEQIAKKHLKIATLETQNLDRLDFHELSVLSVREALLAAFIAGADAGVAAQAQGRNLAQEERMLEEIKNIHFVKRN